MPSSGASVMFTPTKPFPSGGICRQIWYLRPGILRDPRRGFPYFGPDNESGSSGSLVRAGHCGIGFGHPGFWAAGGWRGPHTGIAGDQGLTMVVMALWGLRFWLNPRPQLLWPPICWAVIAFAVYAVSRYLTADIEYVARQELIRVLIYTFLFFAILNNLHRQESTQVISLTMIFLALAISLYAIYQFLTGSSKVPSLGATIESLIFPHKTWFFTSPYQH